MGERIRSGDWGGVDTDWSLSLDIYCLLPLTDSSLLR